MSSFPSSPRSASSRRIPVARFMRGEELALLESRRAFNRGLRELQEWRDANPNASHHELWGAYTIRLQSALESQNETVFFASVHPQWRSPVARLLLQVAWAKMQLEPVPDVRSDQSEARLWSASLAASPLATRQWEQNVLETRGELGFGFGSVLHRLADLYRRAQRSDDQALRLYILVFTGANAFVPTSRGRGSDFSPSQLLERGAAISPDMSIEEIGRRAQLCAQLLLRGFAAPWVGTSLEIAGKVLKVETRLSFLERSEILQREFLRQREQNKANTYNAEEIKQFASERLKAEQVSEIKQHPRRLSDDSLDGSIETPNSDLNLTSETANKEPYISDFSLLIPRFPESLPTETNTDYAFWHEDFSSTNVESPYEDEEHR